MILQVSRVLEKKLESKGFWKKIENRRGFGFYCRFWIESQSGNCWFWLRRGVLYDKIPMDWVGLTLLAKISKNPHLFMITPFRNRWDSPPLFKENPKKSYFFLIRKFRIGRDPPAPLLEFFWRKKTVFFMPPLSAGTFQTCPRKKAFGSGLHICSGGMPLIFVVEKLI